MFFEDIVGEHFTEQIKLVKSDSEKEQSTVSVNDQSILFYIAGFIIKALKKRYYVVSSKNLTNIDKLVSHSDSSSFGNVPSQRKPKKYKQNTFKVADSTTHDHTYFTTLPVIAGQNLNKHLDFPLIHFHIHDIHAVS
jgi:hypothetical protein